MHAIWLAQHLHNLSGYNVPAIFCLAGTFCPDIIWQVWTQYSSRIVSPKTKYGNNILSKYGRTKYVMTDLSAHTLTKGNTTHF